MKFPGRYVPEAAKAGPGMTKYMEAVEIEFPQRASYRYFIPSTYREFGKSDPVINIDISYNQHRDNLLDNIKSNFIVFQSGRVVNPTYKT